METCTFRPLAGIFEPSAIQQLPDGRFLVVEDEKQHPFSLVTLTRDGGVSSSPVDLQATGADAILGKLDDLEGLTLSAAGHIYATTSHSRSGDGEAKKSRDKLVRFRIEGDRVVDPAVCRDLKPALIAAHPALAAAAEVQEVKNANGLNIEAIDISPDQRQLLLGLRSPLLDGRAIIATVENPDGIFDGGEAPRVCVALTTIDLGGDGLRGMSWIPALDGYLLISGPVARQQVQFKLWFWSGQRDTAPRRVGIAGVPGLEHGEGITPAIIDGEQCIVIVSDDGRREEGRCARFLLLRTGQLDFGRHLAAAESS